MSVARSLPSSLPSSSAPRLAGQFLRTRTSTTAPSQLLTTGPSRRQAALLPLPSPLRRGVAATAGWFQVANGSSWIQSGRRDTATRRFSTAGKIAEAKAEFKRYGFEEITASLPTTSTSSTSTNTNTTTTPPPILIDVREPAELRATGIIPTAQNIPIGTHPDALFLPPDEFLTRFGFAKPKAKESSSSSSSSSSPGEGEKPDIVFYCKAGVRARAMAALAVQAGYHPRRLGVYDGSWLDWEKKGVRWRSGRGGE
ncbi:rhodanese domain-containing protein [Histoplasma capsulatum]|uniref:Rhodanese domain-containing protein n=1 Tax=Ajellomyces capsulatus TaxID=5037 RepID=A0A8H7YZ79_AJECA|nr:rhodanese domain-containing protein [Histoplasma capsulatum]